MSKPNATKKRKPANTFNVPNYDKIARRQDINLPSRTELLAKAKLLRNPDSDESRVKKSPITGIGLSHDPQKSPFIWGKIFQIPEILKNDPMFKNAYGRDVIAIKHLPNIMKYLTSAKYTDEEISLQGSPQTRYYAPDSEEGTHLENPNRNPSQDPNPNAP